jgi:hypothetical protein
MNLSKHSKKTSDFGDFTRGFAGMGGCIFTIRYTFMTADPSFSTSDTAWRMCAGLNKDWRELLAGHQKPP